MVEAREEGNLEWEVYEEKKSRKQQKKAKQA